MACGLHPPNVSGGGFHGHGIQIILASTLTDVASPPFFLAFNNLRAGHFTCFLNSATDDYQALVLSQILGGVTDFDIKPPLANPIPGSSPKRRTSSSCCTRLRTSSFLGIQTFCLSTISHRIFREREIIRCGTSFV